MLDEKSLVTSKAGIQLHDLLSQAMRITDLQAAWEMQKAEADLFEVFLKPKLKLQA